ncbi:LysR family transcriptional regulator [Maritalea porphyrae]|uniref:LysR family transcriptional regulator n=1 Tax=Maritalea porphyrae TaxID=880732 RepID=A0ABQ5UMK9_9HYPH|nr:LysR family transcriptional regulator [Maritalea porphyrae]GLQ16453.1 LysR family transcriptional regulator [Maritalea porphyrae]
MENWDNIRFFLAVARSGSVRGAALALRVTHSTVLRRISQLEAQLGARLFEKLPSGYALTGAGEEIFELSGTMESISSQLQSRVFARDQSLSGSLRIALPPSLATDLLMPDLADFTKLHPAIEMQVNTSYRAVNLTTRQADVAIRLVYDQMSLPQHLIGSRLEDVYRGVYVAKSLLICEYDDVRWIKKKEDGELPSWAAAIQLGKNKPPVLVDELSSQVAAARAGLGVTILPCFVGDSDPQLERLWGSSVEYYGTIWLLTLDETRKTKRIKEFIEFIKLRIKSHRAELSGNI